MKDKNAHLVTTHLSWAELACHDTLRTPYPLDWRGVGGRAERLAMLFEYIRKALGNRPLRILSAYRTPEHNAEVGGAKRSQHVQGRALDLAHFPECSTNEFHKLVEDSIREDVNVSSRLGGLGFYPWGVHVDVRPQVNNQHATWRA